MSGAGGITGTQGLAGIKLALAELGNKIGGLPATLVTADDQQKPEIGRQLAQQLMLSDKVDVIIASTFSNVLLSMAQPVVQNKTILISANAGPSQLAGKDCSPYFFNTSWQGDNFAEAMGAYLTQQGVKNIYVMAPNYAAGHDVITGFKRDYQGTIVGEQFTPLAQMDFSAELTTLKASGAGAVFAFYPGGLGIQFIKQYAQYGLGKTLPLYTSYTIDETSLPAMGDAAMGLILTTFWTSGLNTPANQAFVAAFRKHEGYQPAFYAAQSYDAVRLLNAAVTQVNGKLDDQAALIQAIGQANFTSVRGHFKFANDHFPIQDFYLAKVVPGADGKATVQLGDVVLKDHGNAYQGECAMK
jgi:branched-chain amino acid transport system substrate-binding protein